MALNIANINSLWRKPDDWSVFAAAKEYVARELDAAGNDEGEGEVTPEGCCHNFIN